MDAIVGDTLVRWSVLPKPSVAVVILTYNEALHISRAIESIRPIAAEIIVVDSHSTDATVALAEAAGARVLAHPFENQAKQFNWALDAAGIVSDWILRLDADEVLEPDLVERIRRDLPRLGDGVVGVSFKRKHIFMDRWIRHGGRYPLVLLRLWRRGCGRVEDRWMDEHVVTTGGEVITMEGGFRDDCLRDLSFFTDKHNRYATREAVQVLAQRLHGAAVAGGRLSAQARLKRRLKEMLFERDTHGVGPALYFIYRYVFRLGFLDGREGLIYHLLQGFWYRCLCEAKLVELERSLRTCASPAEALSRMQAVTGLHVASPADSPNSSA